MRQEDRLVTWKLVYIRQAQKDAKKLAAAVLKDKAVELLEILERNPFETPPPHDKLKSDPTGACSRQISVQRRLVYQVLEKEKNR